MLSTYHAKNTALTAQLAEEQEAHQHATSSAEQDLLRSAAAVRDLEDRLKTELSRTQSECTRNQALQSQLEGMASGMVSMTNQVAAMVKDKDHWQAKAHELEAQLQEENERTVAMVGELTHAHQQACEQAEAFRQEAHRYHEEAMDVRAQLQATKADHREQWQAMERMVDKGQGQAAEASARLALQVTK